MFWLAFLCLCGVFLAAVGKGFADAANRDRSTLGALIGLLIMIAGISMSVATGIQFCQSVKVTASMTTSSASDSH